MRMKRNWPILLIFAIFVLGAVSVFAEAEVEIQTDGANLNLRYEPSTESEVIASIPNGTIVTATRQTDDGEWMEVAYDGTVGWIDADLANVLSGELDVIVAAVETESNDKAVITNLRITSEGDSETIKVAFIRSTLGSQEEADVLALQGAQLAIEQIMADDDVLADYDIELMVYEANTTEEAAEAYEDAVDDDATIILGPNDQRQREAIFRDYAVDTPLFYVDTETSSEA
ncbi:MAG: SH3 domain-containing protein, partial [Anaerolineae bacterium]|nr:SH3 domain-containing protein [Anaerolineae bacterium]